MYRFLLTRRWVGLLLALVLVAAACVLLGRWQLHRLAARHAANELVTSNVAARPVPVEAILTVGHPPPLAREYARVRASGRYDDAHRLLVRNRPYQGATGFHVLVPFVTDDGPALLVDRGWVPAGETAVDLPKVPRPPSGEVTVLARVRPSEPASTTGTPPKGQVTRIDVGAIRASLPYDVYGGYGELTAERPAPRTAPALLQPPENSEGPHLAYAFQWFLFAVIALVGYVMLARREAADLRAAAAPNDAPTVPRARVAS